jgi:SAM-dependent methyltransferase
VVIASSRERGDGRPPPPRGEAPEVVWHDLECGRYRADLALWRELATGPVLDVGAGTGRVALNLACAGRHVTALELDPVLLRALQRRAAGTTVCALGADARAFALPRRDFQLCVMAMQTIQLLGGPAARAQFLRRARAHLRPGGLLACAIVTDLEPFDCAASHEGPHPETARVDGTLYISSPTRVQVRRRVIRIERERQIIAPGVAVAPGLCSRETDVVELDRVSAAELQREGQAAGLSVQALREVAPTEEHVGSTVVILRA